MKKTFATGSVLILLSVVLLGCAHEKRIEGPSTENRPSWTLNSPSPSNGKVYFVGRSLAINVLDEKHGINEATNDAIYQIARAAGADVEGRAKIVDIRQGEAIRGKEQTEQPSRDEVYIDVNGTVIGMRQEDVFWERYSVREKFGEEEFVRYKYYVLVSVPEEELKRLEEQKKKQQ